MNTKIIKFDINKNLYDTLLAKQGDTKSRFLLFNLLDGSIPFSLENRSVRVYAIKPDGTEVFNDLIITDAAKGYCILELTTQMLAVAGTVKLELMVIEGEKKLTSNIFYMDVKKSINSEKAIVSTNEFGSLLIALQDVNNWNNEFTEKSGKLEELYTPRLNELGEQLDNIVQEEKGISYLSTTVFTQNVDFSAKYFRIPFGCVTKNGVIIAGCDVRYQGSNDQSYIDIGIARSLDGGKTWQDKKIAMRNNNVNPNYSRVMDGTILYDEDINRIYLLGNYWNTRADNWTNSNTHKDGDWDIKLCYSDDEGLNWSEPVSLRDLCPSTVSQFIGGVGSGIKTSNGTLIFPIQLAKLNDNPYNVQSGLMYSTDGINWAVSESYVPAYTSECNVFEYRGEIYINCRQEGSNKRAIYKTSNLGSTWTYCSTLSENTNQANACMGSTIKIHTDDNLQDLILFSCVNSSVRGNLTLKVLNFNDTKFNNVVNYYNMNTDGYSCLIYDKWNKKLYSVFETLGNLQFTDLTPSLQNCYLEKSKEKDEIKKIPYISTALTLCISDNGNDSNADGSESNPFTTTTALLNYAKKLNANEIYIKLLSDISTPFFIYDYYGKISVINSGYGASARNIKRVHVKNCKWVNIDNSNGGINVNTEYSDKIGIAIEYSTVFISGVNLTYATNVIANLYINASNVVIGSGNITSGQVFAQLVRNSTLTANNVTVSKNMDWLIVDNSANKFVYNVPPTSGSGILPRTNKIFNTSLITTWSEYNGTSVSYNRIFELTPTNEKLSNPSTTMPRALLQNSVIHLNGGMLINEALTNEEVILTVPEFMRPRYYKTFQATLFNADNSKSRGITCLLSGNGEIKIYGDVNNTEYNKIYFDTAYTLY